MGHPKFLGFLWKHHSFRHREDKICTKKCIHCGKEKHDPRYGDTEKLEPLATANLWPHGSEGYNYRRCKICGEVERQFIEVGPGAGFPSKWEKAQ